MDAELVPMILHPLDTDVFVTIGSSAAKERTKNAHQCLIQDVTVVLTESVAPLTHGMVTATDIPTTNSTTKISAMKLQLFDFKDMLRVLENWHISYDYFN